MALSSEKILGVKAWQWIRKISFFLFFWLGTCLKLNLTIRLHLLGRSITMNDSLWICKLKLWFPTGRVPLRKNAVRLLWVLPLRNIDHNGGPVLYPEGLWTGSLWQGSQNFQSFLRERSRRHVRRYSCVGNLPQAPGSCFTRSHKERGSVTDSPRPLPCSQGKHQRIRV